MIAINILLFIHTRFRMIEVQIIKDNQEITYNIFKKINITIKYRNLFIILVTIFHGFLVTFYMVNIVMKDTDKEFEQKSKLSYTVPLFSYFVSISIWILFFAYMMAFIMGYRSL